MHITIRDRETGEKIGTARGSRADIQRRANLNPGLVFVITSTAEEFKALTPWLSDATAPDGGVREGQPGA